MKITKLIIPNYRQFRDFEIDFTYPKGHEKEGQPLEKVCFIGKNGTGKSTLLKVILGSLFTTYPRGNDYITQIYGKNQSVYKTQYHIFDPKIAEIPNWIDKALTFKENEDEMSPFRINNAHLRNADFAIFSPAESYNNLLLKVDDVPQATLNEALKWGKNDYNLFNVSQDRISDFWQQLIFLLKQREEAFQIYAEENSEKSYKQLRAEFEEKHPDILKQLAIFWDKMLGKVGLYFDYESAKKPVQLTDNLLAYIKLKSTKETIPYNELSTGIRNFIFRLGHIFSLFFGQKIENGFLLVDEPENSLFPDFRYDLIGIYQEMMTGSDTQFFVATHDPIIAAQFESCERIILDFDEMGYVIAKKG